MQEKYCGSSLSTAAQFLRQVSGFDPHADPHGENERMETEEIRDANSIDFRAESAEKV